MHTEEKDRGTILIDIARRTLTRALGRSSPAGDAEHSAGDHPWLLEPGAVFVTLKIHGVLRGCVGSLLAVRPLLEDVRDNIVAAAFRDSRFPPVEPRDLDHIEIEVTELSAPVPMHFTSEAEALAQLRPGEDGLVLRWGRHRATYLPQVWESLPAPRDFLTQLKRKAGLPDDFWDDSVKLERYSARKWSERGKPEDPGQ